MAFIASTLAFTRCFSAVTKARSLDRRSFHHPQRAEKVAQTNISFTGV